MIIKKKLFNLAMYCILIIASLLVIIPVLWMLSTALKPPGDVMVSPPKWIPDEITFAAFKNIWTDYPFATYFTNSIIVVSISTLLAVSFSALAGYGVSRFKFKGKGTFLTFLLITQMFPSVMLIIPFYNLLQQYQLLDTHWGLILVYISFCVPFCTWMMLGFFKSIPIELDEAARIDGCNKFMIFLRIILPISLPGLAATTIYAFLLGWNEYMFAFVLTNSDQMRTLPVGIAELDGYYSILWNELMAAAFISSFPLLIMFIFLQKYFISSLTAGAVKQ